MKRFFIVKIIIQELLDSDFKTVFNRVEMETDRLGVQDRLTDFYNDANRFAFKKIPKSD